MTATTKPARATTPQSGIAEPERSLYGIAIAQFAHAADILHLDDGWRAILSHCKRELTVNFPVKMDNGSIRVFTGFRVQHNMARGPFKGGLRYHQNVTLDEVRDDQLGGDVAFGEVDFGLLAVEFPLSK